MCQLIHTDVSGHGFGDRKTLSSASKVDYRKIKLTLDVNLRQLNYDRLHSYLVLPRIGGRGELLPADGAEGRLSTGALGVYADTGAFLPHLPAL